MNVLYLHAHDTGRFISPYREGLPTPNLAAFAERATVFTEAHCAAPTCSPSRAALLTGVTPHEAGMLGLAHRGFSLRDPKKHLAAFLKRNGYETALSGIQHVFRGEELEAAYDRVFRAERGPDYMKYDRRVAEQAAAFLREEKTKPFFLDCGFWLPHRPFPPPSPGFDPAAIALPDFLPDSPKVRADWASFLTAVESMDRCAGIVLAALREAKLEDETLVIFTVDHGIAFPGMKCNLTGAGTGVSLMVRLPGDAAAGARCDALVSQLDLYPTICELCKLEAPEWLQGKSLVSLFEGAAREIRGEVFSEVTYHAAYEAMRGVRTREFNLILIFDDDLSPVPANIDDSAAKEVLLGDGLLGRKRESVRLFDLRSDPEERRNVAEDPNYAEVRASLEKRLHKWMATTNDPLLDGPVPLPPGAWCNPREHVSADEE